MKYSVILNLFLEQYPSPKNTKAIKKDYPHKEEEITKVILTTKLKAIRQKFRLAADSGRKSEHRRVVLLYFESCEEIWSGSPATTAIASGIVYRDSRRDKS